MWVVGKGLGKMFPSLKLVGAGIGGIFCVTLLISTVTGGNMFQAWNVGILASNYYGVPEILTGIILAVIVAAVIIGGIKRIGAVAGRLVPFMCLVYVLAAGYVLIVNFDQIPGLLALIVNHAFSPTEAQGAFIGGTASMALMWGMKRALFSSEAGQGSAPIAHSAAKTDEPVREGVVAGLEPFIDTIIVCTLTSLVILSSGAWNRGPEAMYPESPEVAQTDKGWTITDSSLPTRSEEALEISGEWKKGDQVFTMLQDGSNNTLRLNGSVQEMSSGDLGVSWGFVESAENLTIKEPGIYAEYAAAALTSYSFDRVLPGLGAFLVPLAAFLFAVSTMISWSYYGEQGVVYMFGQRAVLPYKIVYCLLIIVACSGLIKTTEELDNLTGVGTGIMLFANIPIMLIFGRQAMKAYHAYIGKLKRGEFKEHDAPPITKVVEGDD
jgi:AGCS family alanine or glycine:cation symporter